jgi:putative transposase
LVQPTNPVSVRHQCSLLGLARSSLYYQPVEVSAEELALMRRIDEIYLELPIYGSRRMTQELVGQDVVVNRKRVQRLMRIMGLEGIAPGPSTSKPHPEHVKYPYLLRGLDVVRPDQVWATDITYLPLAHGYGYLVAIMDWYSRAVLAWRISNTLSTDFCIQALEEALRHHGPPEIFNSDQGSQFTDKEFTRRLLEEGVRISMDGKGRCLDNVFVERLWRSLKYEDIYLHAYEDLRALAVGVGEWFRFYNHRRRHQGIGNRTPMEAYRGAPQLAAA